MIRSQSELTDCLLGPDSVLELLRQSEVEAAEGRDRMHALPMMNGWSSVRAPCCDLWSTSRGGGGVPASQVRRRAARVLLKAAAIPERVVAAEDGALGLEIREGGEWRALPLDWPEPIASAGGPRDPGTGSR